MFKIIKESFSKRKKLANNHPEILRYEELEQRVLFSADVVPGLDTAAVEEQVIVEDVGSDAPVEREAEPETVEQTALEASWELVLVNDNVADYEQLIADLQTGVDNRIIEVVVLESDRDGIEQVTEALDIDVTGGEQDCDLTVWRRMIDMRAVDVVQPDICYLGGLTRTLRVAEMARQAGLPCTPHSANLSLVTVFTLHMMGAIPGAGPYVEFTIEGRDYYPWQENLFEPALVVRDGKVQIPDGPGWGVEINPGWLDAADRMISEVA